MKVVQILKVQMMKTVEVPDELWRRFNEPVDDAEADKAQEELAELMRRDGVQIPKDVEWDHEDEWYDPVEKA
jgi:hypothetical protein